MKRFFSMFIVCIFIPVLFLSCSNQFVETQDITKTPIDVVILAGQSNMAGLGVSSEAREYISEENFQELCNGVKGIYIYSCNDLAAVGAGCDFIPYSNVTFGHGFYSYLFGPEVGFALECKKANKSLVIIKYAAGGMPIEYFVKDNNLSELMETYIASCLLELETKGFAPSVQAVCWMQGEADCNELYTAQKYYNREKYIIQNLRDKYNKNLIFIDAQITDMELLDPGLFQDYVNDAKIKIAGEEKMCYIINSSGLTKEIDNLHYDTPSVLELGRRFAREYLEHETNLKKWE